MELIYLGGAGEVGASAILVKLNEYNILLDSGIRQSTSKDKLPDFDILRNEGGIDVIIISHAHMDHIGSLPLISREYPNAKIFMNKMTLDLTRVLLYDNLKIMNYHGGEIPIFNENDVLDMFDKVTVVPYQKEVIIHDDLKLTFYMAGHIAGASVTYIKSKEGTVLYTGDYSLFPQHTISGLSVPKLRPDVLISEATYGNRLHANREVEEMRLIDTVCEVINNNGKVLIPVFALGRSQEILLILKRAMNKKQITNTKIYVDGMVRDINRVFLNNPLYLKESIGKRILKGNNIFYNDNIIKVEDDNDRQKIVNSSQPLIVVSSSGMLMGGMSEFYASHFIENKNNAIILTGYQDEESNGSMLLNLLDEKEEDRKLKLNGKVHNVLCNVTKVGLSAHADKQEIKNLFNTLTPKYIILGHGEEDSLDEIAREATRENSCYVYVPRIGDKINLEIRNPRKQIEHSLNYIYSKDGTMEEFHYFIKENYNDRLFTKEDLAYIYYGRDPISNEIDTLTKELIDSPYFTQDKKRYFLFKIANELEIQDNTNKEIKAQDIENIIIQKMSEFPYKKISYYLAEKRVVLTFDFPKVVSDKFYNIAKEIYDDTGIKLEKNNNINTLACENKIREIIGDNVNKISYLPNYDLFKIKVYKIDQEWYAKIKEAIGYDSEFVLVPKSSCDKIILTGKKLEQNEAFAYIDNYFKDKKHKPYKKSLKNGNIVLSFITYQIGSLYKDDISDIEKNINWNIELNGSANINMIFVELDNLLNKYEIKKIKNPSFIAQENKVKVKVEQADQESLKEEFYDITGLRLEIEY